MHGVPADLDLGHFIGQQLNQLCLGPYDLQFHFSGGANILVESTWRLFDAKGDVVDESVGRVGDPPGNRSRNNWQVRVLVGDTVKSAMVDPPRSFSLMFSSGYRLTVFDDDDKHESFSIQPGDIFV